MIVPVPVHCFSLTFSCNGDLDHLYINFRSPFLWMLHMHFDEMISWMMIKWVDDDISLFLHNEHIFISILHNTKAYKIIFIEKI